MTDTQEFNTIDEIPRYQPSNPYKYDNLTLAKRKQQVDAACKDYPNVSPNMIEMAWDLIQNKPEAEINDIINNGTWEKADKKTRDTCGVAQNIVIE